MGVTESATKDTVRSFVWYGVHTWLGASGEMGVCHKLKKHGTRCLPCTAHKRDDSGGLVKVVLLNGRS